RNSPDGPDSCEITRAITLVHLTTGTFNHFVKDPIALRLSGAFQVPQGNPWSSSKLAVCFSTPADMRPKPLQTNLSNLPRAAAFCQCGFLWKSGANLFY